MFHLPQESVNEKNSSGTSTTLLIMGKFVAQFWLSVPLRARRFMRIWPWKQVEFVALFQLSVPLSA
jgi:hypothetical protein